jgi:ribose-phosphate pyrophosphokinase
MDVHNLQAFQNAFTIPAENLDAGKLFATYLAPLFKEEEAVVMSPDFGGVKRAEQFLETLQKALQKELPFALMEKYRSSGQVWGDRIAGNVCGKTVIILDDLISTGGTIARAAAACEKAGAKSVIALATHGLFTGKPDETLQEPALRRIITTNTIPPFRLENARVKEKLTVLDVTPLFAEAIRRMENGGSISELLEN